MRPFREIKREVAERQAQDAAFRKAAQDAREVELRRLHIEACARQRARCLEWRAAHALDANPPD